MILTQKNLVCWVVAGKFHDTVCGVCEGDVAEFATLDDAAEAADVASNIRDGDLIDVIPYWG